LVSHSLLALQVAPPLLSVLLEKLLSLLILHLLRSWAAIRVVSALTVIPAAVLPTERPTVIIYATTMHAMCLARLVLGYHTDSAVISLAHYHFSVFENIICCHLSEALLTSLS
jgi:hypothetical protein